jgi:hypothetical protein
MEGFPMMRRILIALLAFAFAFAQGVSTSSFAGQGMGPGPGNKAYSGGGSFGTISIQQAWAKTTALTTTAFTPTWTNIPTAGGLLVVAVDCGSNTATLSIADLMTDGGTWNTAVGPTRNALIPSTLYVFWKVVGATANVVKTATVTKSATCKGVAFFSEYKTTSGTFALDGTPTSSTGTAANPSPGAITTASSSSLVMSLFDLDAALPTAGSGYTLNITDVSYSNDGVETQITTVSGSYNPGVTVASGLYTIQGVAWMAQ